MNDREMRALLQEIIEDVDQGRLEVETPRALRRAGSVLIAAAALGLSACSGQATRDRRAPSVGPPRTAQVDAGPSKRAAPTPPPPAMDPMRRDVAVPAYGVPSPAPDMRPKPRQRPPLRDNQDQPLYGVP